ncbi:MAG: sigma-70 family RNA polymerase sigma factor [Patescibacteria group bacterium]
MRDSSVTDEQLVLEAQQGSREAFGVLVERYQARLLRYARVLLFDRADTEDLVQDAFLQAYRNLQSFRAGARFSPWIYRIVHNVCVNAGKRRIREVLTDFSWDVVLPLGGVSSSTLEEDRLVIRDALERCLRQLDVKYREPLVLAYLEEMDYQMISDVLHIPLATVGVRLMRGREKLRSLCEQHRYE